jgi:hypothetical protein
MKLLAIRDLVMMPRKMAVRMSESNQRIFDSFMAGATRLRRYA